MNLTLPLKASTLPMCSQNTQMAESSTPFPSTRSQTGGLLDVSCIHLDSSDPHLTRELYSWASWAIARATGQCNSGTFPNASPCICKSYIHLPTGWSTYPCHASKVVVYVCVCQPLISPKCVTISMPGLHKTISKCDLYNALKPKLEPCITLQAYIK